MVNAMQEEKWNMGMAYLQRIDRLLTLCDFYQENKDGIRWYDTLMNLYKEVYSKLDKEERKKADNYLKNLSLIKSQKKIPIDSFLDFELYLRDCMEKRDMITPKVKEMDETPEEW